jgi:hypothetical protein
MSTKSHALMRCGTLRKSSISTRGYAEIHIQRPFLTIKIAYEKFLDSEFEWWKHALVPPLHIEIFIFENH